MNDESSTANDESYIGQFSPRLTPFPGWSHDSSQFMTGSYYNLFRIGLCNSDHNRQLQSSEMKWTHLYQADIDPAELPSRMSPHIRPVLCPKRIDSSNNVPRSEMRYKIPLDKLDYKQKVLHSDWHPNEHIIGRGGK